MELEQKHLDEIHSNKDISLYLSARTFVKDYSTFNRSIILNFAENGKHGCDNTCEYCSWKNTPDAKRNLTPNLEYVKNFCNTKNFLGYKITLSGGGDPLYNFDKNWTDLQDIIITIKEENLLVDIITRKWKTYAAHLNLLEPLINMPSFSIDILDFDFREFVGSLAPTRISTIFDPESSTIGKVIDYIEFYKDYVDMIYFREDYNKPCFLTNKIQNIIKFITTKYPNVRFLSNMVCSNNLFLVKDEVRLNQNEIKDFFIK